MAEHPTAQAELSALRTGDDAPRVRALPPLRVSGIVARKADLIAALRVYVPALTDIQVTEDGEHFWLMVDEETEQHD